MITELQAPSDFQSAHEDLMFVVSSDNVSEPNFKYVFDIYINASIVSRVKVWPEPDHDLGIYNASEVIRSYFTQTEFTGHEDLYDIITSDGHFQKEFTVEYGEEYGTPVTTYANVLTGTPITVYNFYNDILYRRIDNSLEALKNTWLSTNPNSTHTVRLNDNYYFTYWNWDEDELDIVITTYDELGTQIATQTTVVPIGNDLISINCGALGINTTHAGLIDEDVHSYTVAITNDSQTITKTFELCADERFPSYGIHFLNQWGGFDTFLFTKMSRRKAEFEQKTFSKRNYKYDSGGALGYNEYNGVLRGSKQVYFSKYTHKFNLCSELLTDEEFRWAFQLVVSPLVYLEMRKGQYIIQETGEYILDESGTPIVTEYGQTFFYPVKVEGSSYDFKTRYVDKLNPLTIDIEVLEQYNSQYA